MNYILNIHINAFKIVLNCIKKNSWYWFFIPGIIISLQFCLFDKNINYLYCSKNDSLVFFWLGSVWNWIVDGISYIANFTYSFLLLTALSPLNAFFTEKIDSKLTNRKFTISITRIIKDIFRAIFIFSTAILLEGVIRLIYNTLGFFTGLEIITDIILFLSSSFFIGFSFYDYALERHKFNFLNSWKFAFNKISFMIICGSIFQFLIKIPFIGIIISPVFLSLYATVVYLILSNQIRLYQE